ncbi:hypothetical protein ZIOFF_068278 [Zingiber officinale]|uniref:Uncharacterized protein n=1 Tax=Zingiber officinale TaxID=94328 RepID=A0A8J5C801_ZINOF|nr:hypothetical protein ZIOFF_068278 [Zingiber officinale]
MLLIPEPHPQSRPPPLLDVDPSCALATIATTQPLILISSSCDLADPDRLRVVVRNTLRDLSFVDFDSCSIFHLRGVEPGVVVVVAARTGSCAYELSSAPENFEFQLLMVQHLILRTPQADPIPYCFLVVFKDCIIFMEASTCQMCLIHLHPERLQWVLYHQMPHGSGVTNRVGINVVGNHAFSSSNINGVTGSIIGISSISASGNHSSVPGLGVSPVLGNVGPRLTSSIGNIIGSGNMGRSISSGGLSVPSLASRVNLATNNGSGSLNVQGTNRLISSMLQQGSFLAFLEALQFLFAY